MSELLSPITLTPNGAIPIEVELVQAPERGHHRFGASKLNYISDCPGWENQESSDKAQAAADEGTKLHNIMELVLRAWALTRAPLEKHLAAIVAANPVEDSQYEYLVFCCREVEKYISKPGARVALEQEVTVYNPDGTKLNHGFLDVLVIIGLVAVILDYKFGWVPVREATTNKQGMDYALGTLQRYGNLVRCGTVFIQPKLHSVTRHVVERSQIPQVYSSIKNTIDLAIAVQADREKHKALLNVSDSCCYCKHKMTCSAGLRHTLAVTRAISPVQIPTSLNLDAIRTPEQAALCRYAVEVAEEFIEGIKARAKELAEQNGGEIEAVLPTGEMVRYQIEMRNHDRSLGETWDIVEALEPLIEAKRLFGAAEFSLGKLEKLVGDEIYENTNTPLDAELDKLQKTFDAEVAAGKITKTEAKKRMSEARQRLGSDRLTKEGAKQRFADLLTAHGLLSRPDGQIPVLKRKKTVKQITQ